MTLLLFRFTILDYCLFFLHEYLNASFTNFLDEDVIHLEDHQDVEYCRKS